MNNSSARYRMLAFPEVTATRITVTTHVEVTIYVLAALYLCVVIYPVTQLIRIQLRVKKIGWTTQKLFLLLTSILNTARFLYFIVTPYVNGGFYNVDLDRPLTAVLADLPGSIFFSTFSLLILFWSEILAHAQGHSTLAKKRLRSIYMTVNLVVYLIQLTLWLLIAFLHEKETLLDQIDDW
eukprot:Colp12_sorted_trinity150504_noHs@10713